MDNSSKLRQYFYFLRFKSKSGCVFLRFLWREIIWPTLQRIRGLICQVHAAVTWSRTCVTKLCFKIGPVGGLECCQILGWGIDREGPCIGSSTLETFISIPIWVSVLTTQAPMGWNKIVYVHYRVMCKAVRFPSFPLQVFQRMCVNILYLDIHKHLVILLR